MSENRGHIFHMAHKWVEDLKPLDKPKGPFIAFCLGVLFGAIGVAIYLQSWKDFLICMGLFLFVAVVLIPTGLGTVFSVPIELLFSGFYGFFRVLKSNEKLAAYKT
jgi:hypothetical protein